MDNQGTDKVINLLTLRIFWGALLASHFLYAYVLTILIGQDGQPPAEATPSLIPIVSSMGIALYGVSMFLPRYMLNNKRKKLTSFNLKDLTKSFTVPFLIRLITFESMMLLGFMLAFMQRRMELFAPFAILSFVSFIIFFPTEEKIKASFK